MSVFADGGTYLSLAYVLLRLPFGLVYTSIVVFIFARALVDLWSLVLLVPAGLAIWGGVVTERALARSWFGVQLAPMAPERPTGRDWRRRLADFASNPVTWKSLVFVVVEATAGFLVGLGALTSLVIGAFGTVGFAVGLLVVALVALIMGPQADIPPAIPPVFLAGSLFSFAILVVTLHVARWISVAQLWFVRVMLGMSQSQVAIAEAGAEAECERTRAEAADKSRRDSHELRNPLATIRAHVDTLRGDGGEEPAEADRHRYLDVLNRETLLTTCLPSRAASRAAPAEALRYE
jgi:signal transduction histidine kinase